MGISVVSGPTEEPVSLIEAKQHCRVDSTDDDGLIAGYILAARHHVEAQIHRPIASRLYEFTADYGWPSVCGINRIDLPYPPLQAVRSVAYVDSSGVEQTLAASQYTVHTNRPRGVIRQSYGVSWPDARWQTENVTVRFVAGYTDFTDTTTSPNVSVIGEGAPDDLRQALLFLIGHWYENREAVNVGNTASELPFAVEALISPYRVVGL